MSRVRRLPRARWLVLCALLLGALPDVSGAATVAGVQSGTFAITTAGTASLAIAAVDPARSVLFFSTRHADNRPGGSMVRGRLAGPATLEFASVLDAPITVQWYVAEFSAGVRVQRGQVSQNATTVNVPIVPVAGLGQTYVTWSKTPIASDVVWSEDDPVIVDLTSVNNLQVRVNTANPGHTIWWQVVEYTNAADINVQRGSAALTGVSTQTSVAIANVDLGRSFLLAGFRTSGTGSDIDERMISADFQNAGSIRFRREDSGDDITEIGWQVIELRDGSSVQRGEASLNNAQTLRTIGITAVDLSRSVAFASVQAAGGQSLGRTRYDGDDILGYGSATLALGATQLTVQRDIGGEHARIVWFVIEFNGPVSPVAEWRFDECAYSNVAGEALDSAGAFHATPFNGIDSDGPGQVARYAALLNRQHHLRTSVAMTNTWSVSVWFRKPFDATYRYHVLGAVAGGGDLLFLDANSNYRWGTYQPGNINYGSFRFGTLSDGWHHLVLTGASNRTRLYIDGVFRDQVNGQTTGTLTYLGTSFDSVNTGSAQGFGAPLDEWQLFRSVIPDAQISAIYANQGAGNNADGTPRSITCASLASFAITVAPSASTCAPVSVTVQALDAGGNPFTGYVGSIDLSTSTGNGNWSVSSGAGVLAPDPDSDDNGAASYAFAAADLGAVSLLLANAHADTLSITATDPAASVSTTSAAVTFSDNAFVITNNDFAYPVAGRDHAFDVTLWRRDTSLPVPDCQVATGYSGVRALDGWYAPGANHPAGAAVPRLRQGGTEFPLGLGAGAAAPVGLTFVNGVAAFDLRTSDVGQYTLNLRDDTGLFATAAIVGASSELTVRPFGFAVTGITAAAPNPGGTTPTDTIFSVAGGAFAATFSAVLYGAGDALDGNGNPTVWSQLDDNLPAPSFAWDTDLGALLNTPAAGVAGTLDRPGAPVGTLLAGEFAGGATPVADLRYSEVGSMLIAPAAANYLGVAGLTVQGRSGPVGRFTPAAFTVTANAPTFDAACTAFTYFGQPLDYSPGAAPVVTVTAVNLQGATTVNYFDFGVGDDWWRLADIAEDYSDPGGNLAYSGSGASHNSFAVPSANGVAVVTFAGTLTYAKPLVSPGAAPFDAAPALSFPVVDLDGVAYAGGADFVLAVPEVAGQNPIRHGRLRFDSAHGSEVLGVAAPLVLQYFDGSNFVTAADDTCSALAVGDFSYSNAPVATGMTGFGAGTGSLDWACSLASPCASGFVDVSAGLAGAGLGWLRYDWDGDALEDDPAARVTFGIYGGNRRQIHVRELY